MTLHPQAAAILEVMNASGFAFDGASPQDVRALFSAMRFESAVELAVVEDRLVPGPAEPIPVRVYRPSAAGVHPVIVYFHGGGWVIGSLDTHDDVCRTLAQKVDAVVVSVDYRLAPEAPFPAAFEDALAATQWVHEHAAELGADPTRLAVAGDSAGGNLAAVVAIAAREDGAPPIAFQLLIYPVTDFEFDSVSMNENADGYMLTRDAMRWFYSHYTAGDEVTSAQWQVSPLRAERLDALPPALVITAGYDPLRDQGAAYAGRLAEAGVEVEHVDYDGMFHGFFAMPALLETATEAVEHAVGVLRRALSVEG